LIDSLLTPPRLAEWTSREGRNLPTSVIPAQAGSILRPSNTNEFALKPALECLNRGRK
jgi:hypothetical protein